MYREVPPQVDLPAVEQEVLTFWDEHDTFHRSLEQRADGEPWVFYEGPPTANGTPGTHHIEARVFKDVFPRYRTMKGFRVPRKAGWDCHGLPVELAVEKELGFNGKQDIEAFGVAEFNAKCRESVLRHVDAFEEMTRRMGYWVDTDQAYWTMDPEYVDSLWWALKQIHARGLLVQDHRVTTYCSRCGTGLSDHEVAQGYADIVDPSVYVRFPITDGPLADSDASLLVWTTTPWTLVANTAVAVHPDVTYVAARTSDGEVLVVAEPLMSSALGDDAEAVKRISGAELVGTAYKPPFDLVAVPHEGPVHTVLPADYVTVSDGTGLVHLAPGFGAEDLAVGRANGLPVIQPVGTNGEFAADVPLVGGVFFKKADERLVADLSERGLLFAHLPYPHAYPHCWRCHTPLMYYALPSWYIRTTAIKDELLAQNEATQWFPESIKHGRYGDWLENNVDWALSRDRYWGTPLPIWRCSQDHVTVVGSRAELAELAGLPDADLDPHRPFVDEIVVRCPECGESAHRVPEVADVWFDSGCMPFAQWGYPHRQSETEFRAQYPADYICEAIDQTRGWFYTLMTVGTLIFGESSYRTVLVLGLLLDREGRKMSKHLGNVIEPIPLMNEHGADAVRWFMLASGSPWVARRVSHEAIGEVVRKTLLTYWNTVSFQALYARLAGWTPAAQPQPAAERTALDRWLIARTQQLIEGVDKALDGFDAAAAGAEIASFVDQLSNWYVRRSRRRFWDGDPLALQTLHEALVALTLVMAPMTPFITERVWQDLVRSTDPDTPDSVHLADWPAADRELIDERLIDDVALVRRLVELGRAARASSGVKTRQPLSRALVSANGWQQLPDELKQELASELNVQSIEGLGAGGDEPVAVTVKANFRALGRRFGKQTPQVAQAIADADAQLVQQSLLMAGRAEVTLDGQPLTIEPDDVIITETPREGWAVHDEAGESVALDLALTPELVRLGLARDVVRQVQEARKSSGLDVSDRITLRWSAQGDVRAAIDEHQESIASEVLAVEIIEDATVDTATDRVFRDPDSGMAFTVTKVSTS
ncbi:MAG TPA: isoleucine--tRNA ligase [Actinomycetes bacterium]|nr:isoleucine--tRNA ligase [Actinomycetes bacterium]